jgi:hypothetical protein
MDVGGEFSGTVTGVMNLAGVPASSSNADAFKFAK